MNKFYTKIIQLLIIVIFVFLLTGVLRFFQLSEGLSNSDTVSNVASPMSVMNGADTNESRAVSKVQGETSTTGAGAALALAAQMNPNMLSNVINMSADQLNNALQNVDSSKFIALYDTFLKKLNPPYPVSNTVVNTNAAVVNNAIVSSGPSSSINASTFSTPASAVLNNASS